MLNFPTSYTDILSQVEAIDPIRYGKTRNYSDGSVTRLSPYISRGVISTREVMEEVLRRDIPWYKVKKFVQELAWRDYWQLVWRAKGSEIDRDIKQPQEDVDNEGVPTAILDGETGVDVMDVAIEQLYQSGYMHNHMRMYVAAVACNFGKSHWLEPARWMYYHLLDADWASNALGWQWVAGSNSRKKYIANQANINRYFRSQQRGTFLDASYQELGQLRKPEELHSTRKPTLETDLPQYDPIRLDAEKPLMVYNFYNLDPRWEIGEEAQKVLLLEPEIFEKYPVSRKSLDFAESLSENIPGILKFAGSFHELVSLYGGSDIHYKEHPLNRHYTGTQHDRDWMFKVHGYYPSFFSFWKKCMKEFRTELA